MRQADLDPGDAPEGTAPHVVPEDDAWVEGRSLISTVEDIELIDPALSSERLLYRLFHERGVRVFRSVAVRAQCSCSRAGVASARSTGLSAASMRCEVRLWAGETRRGPMIARTVT